MSKKNILKPGDVVICILKEDFWEKVNVGGFYVIDKIYPWEPDIIYLKHNPGAAYKISCFRKVKSYKRYTSFLTYLDKIKRNEEKFYD